MKERRGRNRSIYSNSETGVAWCKQKIYHSVGGNKSTCIKVLLDEGEEKIIILVENTHWTESDRKGYVLVFLPSLKVEEQQTGLKRKGQEAGEKRHRRQTCGLRWQSTVQQEPLAWMLFGAGWALLHCFPPQNLIWKHYWDLQVGELV